MKIEKIKKISAITGFFVGIIASYNFAFIGFGGTYLRNFSLGFIFDLFPAMRLDACGWFCGPIFFSLVYAFYGYLIGLIIKSFLKGQGKKS